MVARAVPPGSRRIRRQRDALHAGLSCPQLASVRGDFRRNLEAFWRIFVHCASWGGPGKPPAGTTEPTRDMVCEKAGFSVSTFKACRRWFERTGYLAIVRAGTTPMFRPGILARPGDRNTRQAYVLCAPRRSRGKQVTPSGDCGDQETRPLSGSRSDPDTFPARKSPPSGDIAEDKGHREAAPRSPLFARGIFGSITDGWWAHLTYAFSDWTAAEVVWAVDHWPSGRPHRETAPIRHATGWLAWRLSHWLLPGGTAMPPPSRQRADEARRVRAEQEARRAERRARAAIRAPDEAQAAHAARARELLLAKLGRPAPPFVRGLPGDPGGSADVRPGGPVLPRPGDGGLKPDRSVADLGRDRADLRERA